MQSNHKERAFTVELKSKRNLKNLTLTNGNSETVLLEGTIGTLVQASFKEGIIFEVVGENGVLRVDLSEEEIKSVKEQNPDEVTA